MTNVNDYTNDLALNLIDCCGNDFVVYTKDEKDLRSNTDSEDLLFTASLRGAFRRLSVARTFRTSTSRAGSRRKTNDLNGDWTRFPWSKEELGGYGCFLFGQRPFVFTDLGRWRSERHSLEWKVCSISRSFVHDQICVCVDEDLANGFFRSTRPSNARSFVCACVCVCQCPSSLWTKNTDTERRQTETSQSEIYNSKNRKTLSYFPRRWRRRRISQS